MKYRRILVAVDGSRSSDAALAHAMHLARADKARLRIVHIVEEVGPYLPNVTTAEQYWRAMRKRGERILGKALALSLKNGLKAASALIVLPAMGTLVRHTASAIAREARRYRADVLVIGTHGRRGVARLLLGSVAEGVARSATVPVLLVRGR